MNTDVISPSGSGCGNLSVGLPAISVARNAASKYLRAEYTLAQLRFPDASLFSPPDISEVTDIQDILSGFAEALIKLQAAADVDQIRNIEYKEACARAEIIDAERAARNTIQRGMEKCDALVPLEAELILLILAESRSRSEIEQEWRHTVVLEQDGATTLRADIAREEERHNDARNRAEAREKALRALEHERLHAADVRKQRIAALKREEEELVSKIKAYQEREQQLREQEMERRCKALIEEENAINSRLRAQEEQRRAAESAARAKEQEVEQRRTAAAREREMELERMRLLENQMKERLRAEEERREMEKALERRRLIDMAMKEEERLRMMSAREQALHEQEERQREQERARVILQARSQEEMLRIEQLRRLVSSDGSHAQFAAGSNRSVQPGARTNTYYQGPPTQFASGPPQLGQYYHPNQSSSGNPHIYPSNAQYYYNPSGQNQQPNT